MSTNQQSSVSDSASNRDQPQPLGCCVGGGGWGVAWAAHLRFGVSPLQLSVLEQLWESQPWTWMQISVNGECGAEERVRRTWVSKLDAHSL